MLHYSRLTPQSFLKKGVNVKLFHRVEQIIPAQKLLITRPDAHEVKEYKYHSLVLATGSSPKN